MEWAVAGRAHLGESISGDRAVALDAGGGATLFGVIDGLGHGGSAAEAAGRAAAVLAENCAEPLDILMVLCHRALGETRGAAISLARVEAETSQLSWIGVGNVTADLFEVGPAGATIRASALTAGGIVGYRMPNSLPAQAVTMKSGNLLVLCSDGILSDYPFAVDLSSAAHVIADKILGGHAKDADDATVLTARHRGAPQ